MDTMKKIERTICTVLAVSAFQWLGAVQSVGAQSDRVDEQRPRRWEYQRSGHRS
jgi:hypothetical protein